MNLDQQLLAVVLVACASMAFFAWFCIENGALELEWWLFNAKRQLDNVTFRVQRTIAYMLPRWLVEMATIRLVIHATSGKHSNTNVSELRATTALRRWDKK